MVEEFLYGKIVRKVAEYQCWSYKILGFPENEVNKVRNFVKRSVKISEGKTTEAAMVQYLNLMPEDTIHYLIKSSVGKRENPAEPKQKQNIKDVMSELENYEFPGGKMTVNWPEDKVFENTGKKRIYIDRNSNLSTDMESHKIPEDSKFFDAYLPVSYNKQNKRLLFICKSTKQEGGSQGDITYEMHRTFELAKNHVSPDDDFVFILDDMFWEKDNTSWLYPTENCIITNSENLKEDIIKHLNCKSYDNRRENFEPVCR